MEVPVDGGTTEHVVVEVPAGQGCVRTFRRSQGATTFDAEGVSRLRQILAEAQAVLLLDRGGRW